jgi:hypothetical protein
MTPEAGRSCKTPASQRLPAAERVQRFLRCARCFGSGGSSLDFDLQAREFRFRPRDHGHKSSVKSESSTFPAGLVAGVSEAFRSVKGLAWAQALSGLAVR